MQGHLGVLPGFQALRNLITLITRYFEVYDYLVHVLRTMRVLVMHELRVAIINRTSTTHNYSSTTR